MKKSELRQIIKEEISKILELNVLDFKPKDDLINLFWLYDSDKVGEPYFERKFRKFKKDVETLLQPFNAVIEDESTYGHKSLSMLINKFDKTKVKNILTKLSNRYGYEGAEMEIGDLGTLYLDL